jgi:hypothetical protein
VNVPGYLEINTQNPMKDDVNKSKIISSIYNPNESKNITNSKGAIIPSTLNAYWTTFLYYSK